MGLNSVDFSCIGIAVLRDPPHTLSHGGFGEMVVERDGERKKRREREEEERWEGTFYTLNNTYLPKMDTCLAPSLIVNATCTFPLHTASSYRNVCID